MRIRRRIRGVPERPRLTVSRSLRHIYAQIVDDESGKTLLGVSSQSSALEAKGDKKKISLALGQLVATRAKELGIEAVVFDRDRYPYHGRIEKFAEGARKGGLKF
jgi:large subunit ribosomal protein L18